MCGVRRRWRSCRHAPCQCQFRLCLSRARKEGRYITASKKINIAAFKSVCVCGLVCDVIAASAHGVCLWLCKRCSPVRMPSHTCNGRRIACIMTRVSLSSAGMGSPPLHYAAAAGNRLTAEHAAAGLCRGRRQRAGRMMHTASGVRARDWNDLFDAAALAVPAAACASLSRDFRGKDGGTALNLTLLLRCTSAAISV